MSTRWYPLILMAFCVVLFGWRLGDAPLWDRDEPRNAGCAYEMQQRNDWIVPVFNDELRTHKPILLYWLMLIAQAIFGTNEFSARVVSAIAGCGTVLLTFDLTKRLGRASAAWISAVVLASSLLFTMSARAATPDAILVFTSMLALWSYWRFAPPRSDSREDQPLAMAPGNWTRTIAVYAAMGLAVLAKGPVGYVLPVSVLVAFAWSNRSDGFSVRRIISAIASVRPVTGLFIVLIVAGPWYAWVGYRTDGVWLMEFFGTHNVSRALHAMEGHDGPALLYYPMSLMVGFFPWSIVTIPLILDLFRRRQYRDVDATPERFLLCWLAVYLLLFSVAQTKLPSYLLPTYPAIAILFGSFLDRYVRGETKTAAWWLPLGYTVQLAVGIVLFAVLQWATARYLTSANSLVLLAMIPIVLSVLGLAASVQFCQADRRRSQQVQVVLLSAVLLNLAIFGILAPYVGHYQPYRRAMADLTQRDPAASLVAFGRMEPSWVYYARRPIHHIDVTKPEELERYLQQQPRAILLVARSDRGRLPKSLRETKTVAEFPYFLKREFVEALPLPGARADVARRQGDSQMVPLE